MSAAPSHAELEAMAAALEASGEYRVVRRLDARPPLPSPPAGSRLGLVIDVETTGSDVRGDEVIELAMIRFAYSPEGEVLGVVDTFQGYHEPTRAISAEITALTGISAETVAGHVLDADAVGAFVAPAVIVLAHNAGFDRRFAERLHPWFSTKAWGCTMGEPPWRPSPASSTTSTAPWRTASPPSSSWRVPCPCPAAAVWRTSWSGRGGRVGACGPRARHSSTRTPLKAGATAGAAATTGGRGRGGSIWWRRR